MNTRRQLLSGIAAAALLAAASSSAMAGDQKIGLAVANLQQNFFNQIK